VQDTVAPLNADQSAGELGAEEQVFLNLDAIALQSVSVEPIVKVPLTIPIVVKNRFADAKKRPILFDSIFYYFYYYVVYLKLLYINLETYL
jgi:hypothetical protein